MTNWPPQLLDVQNRVTNESALASTEGDLTGWINEGYIDACRKAKCYQKLLPNTALTGGTADYQVATLLPADLTEIIALTVYSPSYGPQPLELVDVGPIQLLRDRQTIPVGLSPREFALLGLNEISLWPTPNTGDLLAGIYVARPAVVANPTDVFVGLPQEYVMRILEPYALWKAARLDDRLLDTGVYKQEYDQQVAMLASEVKRSAGKTSAATRPRQYPLRPYRRDLDQG